MEYQGVSLGELTALTAETALGTEFTPEPSRSETADPVGTSCRREVTPSLELCLAVSLDDSVG